MTRRTTITRTCDYCEADTDVADYTVTLGSGAARETLKFDACARCEVFVGLPEWEKVGAITQGGRRVKRVVDPSEVDAAVERATRQGRN